MKQPNWEIRRAAAVAGIRLWQVADAIGITDASLSRKLRKELKADEKEKILSAIQMLSQQENEP